MAVPCMMYITYIHSRLPVMVLAIIIPFGFPLSQLTWLRSLLTNSFRIPVDWAPAKLPIRPIPYIPFSDRRNASVHTYD